MESLANVVYPIDPTAYLDEFPAYNTCFGNIQRLNQLRKIIDSFNYAPYSLAFPFGPTSGLVFGAMATKEGSLQIPPGSFLLGISGICLTDVTNPFSGRTGSFRFSVTDKGSGLGLTERGFVFYRNLSGGGLAALPMNGPSNVTANFSEYFRGGIAQVYWLDSPLVITNPGQVQVAMTNLLGSSLTAQMALHFAYPVNNVSVNTPTIKPA
jgi:hypothetical protein